MQDENLISVEEILQRVKNSYGLRTDTQLADFFGVGKTTPHAWKSRNSIDYKLLFTKCRGQNLNWLIWGEREVGPAQDQIPRVTDAALPYLSRVGRKDLTVVPVYGDVLSAGPGRDAGEEEVVSAMGLMTSWLRAEVGIEPARAFVAMVRGESMEELLCDGDLVLCERAERLDRHGIFVVRRWGEVHIKHVQTDGEWVRLISHNAVYPPIEMRAPGADEFAVVGRVVRRFVRI